MVLAERRNYTPDMAFPARPPAVDGKFYPGDADELRREVQTLLGQTGDEKLIGVVAPHAGYVYSGKVAGKVFARVHVPDCVVVMGPNHTGRGTAVSLRTGGDWELPVGRMAIDGARCEQLLSTCDLVREDARAHEWEHSVEVELPFLLARNPNAKLVPLVLARLDFDQCQTLGRALANVLPKDALVVASSDLNHYLTDDETRARDQLAIKPMLALSGQRLHTTVEAEDLSMCGYIPATVMLEYAQARGAQQAELVGYATSAEAFGDKSRCVGYAGIAVS
jgi:AmmeMemoRadiSam system protein B